jgi:hypothetical protein
MPSILNSKKHQKKPGIIIRVLSKFSEHDLNHALLF